MQTSFVFNQARWPGHDPQPGSGGPDIDDCWVVSALQCVHAVTPGARLVGIPAFREAAGNPDDPNDSDGGNLAQIVRGVEGCYPDYKGKLRRLRGASWAEFLRLVDDERRILSVSIVSGKLPVRLQYGFAGAESYHQVSVVRKANRLFANPLAPVYSRFDEVASWDAIKPAVMAYGRAKAGTSGVWAVVFPTEAEMNPAPDPDLTPFSQADLDAAVAACSATLTEAEAKLAEAATRESALRTSLRAIASEASQAADI